MKTIKSYPRKIREIANTFIMLADGCKLAARIWIPVDAEHNPVPAILEYLPYRKRDGTHVRDALTHPYLAGHGYACVRVDMRGNGDSDGLMDDEYTQQEMDDAVAVIAWLAGQAWCSGQVGMMGISWGGFNGLQVAALQPPALKAIVTLCSTDDRYSDDIHYKGGCLLNENLGWSATMFAYSSRPPDPALVGDRWRAMWLQRLEHEPLLAIAWLEHPHRDRYWKHGSVCEDIGAIQAAVLAVGGWNDAYTNAVPRLVGSLKSPSRGIIGPWAHKYPHFALPEPRIGFLQEMLRWWDHWLKGVDTGVDEDPHYRTFIMEPGRPGASVAHIEGRWVSDNHWPADIHALQRLYLNTHGLAGVKGASDKRIIASPQTTGADAGEYCIIWLGPEFAGDQRRDDAGSVTFDSAPLTRDIDIVGATAIQLKLSSDKPAANMAVRLNAVWPDGAVSRLSYGVLNLCHRDSHEHPEPLEPGKAYTVRLHLDDVAVKVRKGQRLRISISTSYWPLIWPAPEAPTLTLHLGSSFVDVPVRKIRRGETPPPFAPAEAAPPVKLDTVRKPSNRRALSIDQKTGEQCLTIVDDFGVSTITEHGLTYGGVGRETYRIRPDDPLSARQECHWTEERSRGDWAVRTESYSTMTASKTHWHVTGRLEAYEGDALVFCRDWDRRIRRKLV